MVFINKKQGDLVLFISGLILVAFWAIGKFIATDWLPNYYVDMFGAVGFLLLGFLGLSRANQKVGPKKEEQ